MSRVRTRLSLFAGRVLLSVEIQADRGLVWYAHHKALLGLPVLLPLASAQGFVLTDTCSC